MAGTDHSGEIELTYCPNGPLLVRGADVVSDSDGERHQVTRPVVAVCLCGKSSRKPWCDGTHKVITESAAARGAR
jgi:CDGSH-type Zn-finger protein